MYKTEELIRLLDEEKYEELKNVLQLQYIEENVKKLGKKNQLSIVKKVAKRGRFNYAIKFDNMYAFTDSYIILFSNIPFINVCEDNTSLPISLIRHIYEMNDDIYSIKFSEKEVSQILYLASLCKKGVVKIVKIKQWYYNALYLSELIKFSGIDDKYYIYKNGMIGNKYSKLCNVLNQTNEYALEIVGNE